MARTNTKPPAQPVAYTHEGGIAARINPLQELRRSVLACLLWEDTFYESGVSIVDRIKALVPLVPAKAVAQLAVEARNRFNLRHVPLLLCVTMVEADHAARKAGGFDSDPRKAGIGSLISDTIEQVIQRADEPAELLALYWGGGTKTKPVSAQLKKGLARALAKFNVYRLAKYDRRDNAIKIGDVVGLTHAKPKDREYGAVYGRLRHGKLEAPDTWEVALSGGADKKETFERMLREGTLGYLALLRNLRNMEQAGVDFVLVADAIRARKGADRVLPFRYVAAARACPQLEGAIDTALAACIEGLPTLPGKTAVLVDVSGSMDSKLSGKSDMTRMDAAAALASLIHGEEMRVFSFSTQTKEVPHRRGMAGIDAIINSQSHGGTDLFGAVKLVNELPYDRLIVISDEQAGDFGTSRMPAPRPGSYGYVINVASNQRGVGYGPWMHIDGFSENVIRWMHEMEKKSEV